MIKTREIPNLDIRLKEISGNEPIVIDDVFFMDLFEHIQKQEERTNLVSR